MKRSQPQHTRVKKAPKIPPVNKTKRHLRGQDISKPAEEEDRGHSPQDLPRLQERRQGQDDEKQDSRVPHVRPSHHTIILCPGR